MEPSKIKITQKSIEELLPKTSESCPYCNSHEIIKFGKYRSLNRYRCKSCKKTFIPTTGTSIYYINKKEKFYEYYEMLKNEGIKSIRISAEKIGISIVTAFDWRHKILMSLSNHNSYYEDKIACETKIMNYSQKGRRGTKKFLSEMKKSKNILNVNVFSFGNYVYKEIKISNIGKLTNDHIDRILNKRIKKNTKIYIHRKDNLKNAINYINEKNVFEINDSDSDNHLKSIKKFTHSFFNLVYVDMHGISTKYFFNYANYFSSNNFYKNKRTDINELIEKRTVWPNYVKMENDYAYFLSLFSKIPYNNPIKRRWKLWKRFENINFGFAL